MAKQGQLKESCQCLGTCPKFLSVRKGEEVGYYHSTTMRKESGNKGRKFFTCLKKLQAGRVYILRYFQCIHVDKKPLFFKENFREKNLAHFIENKKNSAVTSLFLIVPNQKCM